LGIVTVAIHGDDRCGAQSEDLHLFCNREK
jgi:hypothetical protein